MHFTLKVEITRYVVVKPCTFICQTIISIIIVLIVDHCICYTVCAYIFSKCVSVKIECQSILSNSISIHVHVPCIFDNLL